VKYFRGREVAISEDVDRYPQCDLCSKKQPSMWITVDRQLVCHECKSYDKEAEFASEKGI
jgi:hypothetical protein